MNRWMVAAIAVGGLWLMHGGAVADEIQVGTMERIKQTVYGMPPGGAEIVKRTGDGVMFKEAIETWARSGARIRFIDGSELTMGEKSKVQIDTFVFDPAKAAGNDAAGAVINMTAGTLRWITGAMPKGKTVIKTPTAALILRGTTVTVRVHPDGTTDATVQDGSVEAVSNNASQTSTVSPGQGVTARPGGDQAAFPGDADLLDDEEADSSVPQEQRRTNETNAALEHYRYHHQY